MKDKYDTMILLLNEIGVLHYKKNYSNLEKMGLYPGQPVVIEMIYKNEGINQKDLSNLVDKRTSTINIMIDRLIKANIVLKKQDENNMRTTRLYLTDKGKKLGVDIRKMKRENMNKYFNGISQNELDIFTDILGKIKNNLLGEE